MPVKDLRPSTTLEWLNFRRPSVGARCCGQSQRGVRRKNQAARQGSSPRVFPRFRFPLPSFECGHASAIGTIAFILLFGFAVLPIRGMLYTMTQVPVLLIVIQILDGVANCISVVVSILVIKDRTEGTGRFNITADAMATVHGVGAALSAALGGLLIQRWGFKASFAGLAVTVLWWKIPETRKEDPVETSLRPSSFSVPSLPAEDA